MKDLQRFALVAAAVGRLNEAGSRTSRAHVHKALFFAHRWAAQPKVYDFIIYQFGPYSFGLDTDISALLSFSALVARPAKDGYGAQYATAETGGLLVRELHQDIEPWEPVLDFVARTLGTRTSRELQLLGTTAFVLDEHGPDERNTIIAEVLSLKPQYTEDEIRNAIEQVRAFDEEARRSLQGTNVNPSLV